MAKLLTWQGMEVCDDCLYVVSMGYPDDWTDEQKDAWDLAVGPMIPAGYDVVAFCCDGDDSEWGCETYFSNQRCELCDALPGNRHAGTLVLDQREI